MLILVDLAAFAAGVLVVVWATDQLLKGMVGLGLLIRIAPFAIAGIVSGLEAENIAVGLVAAKGGAPEIALGSVFGGSIFVVCVALGLGAMIAPLKVRLPSGVLVVFAATPPLAGLALIGRTTSQLAGAVLLVLFVLFLAYVVRASLTHRFFDSAEAEEVLQAVPGRARTTAMTLGGLIVLALGAELITFGAKGLIASVGVPAALMGMVVTPAAIESEEVIRQVVPARQGRSDVSAGNLVGTVLYFVLFNLGLIALIAPVSVAPLVRTLDWPFLVTSTWLATIFLARGGLSRVQGASLLTLYAVYVVVHLVAR